jgi:phosphoribosylformylglycinamidine synthase
VKKEVRYMVIRSYGPEAHHYRTNHPRWTREELPEEGMGLAFFKNAVQYIRSHLF